MLNTKLATPHGGLSSVSLSSYFPRGTHYFYGYPTGEDSQFLNKVPPEIDELVAARAHSCAGPNVSVVSFASTSPSQIDEALFAQLDIPKMPSERTDLLPESIDSNLTGAKRNTAIIEALTKSIAPRSLVMAQPFVSADVNDLYEIAPEITIWLNDKSNMSEYIRSDLMPTRFAEYQSGLEFASDHSLIDRKNIVPCVVKVTSSSSGDGVYICLTLDDLRAAQAAVRLIDVNVLVEEYVDTAKNYAVHFGIPHDREKSIDIIGFNEQLTSKDGEFLGGIITSDEFPPVLESIKEYLLNDVLPTVRAKGWFGIGGYDVIINNDGKPYLIDGNFRMTGMSAYHFLMANGDITKPMLSFGGTFTGNATEFERAIVPFAGKDSRHKTVQLIALSKHEDRWDFNGALMYSSPDGLRNTINQLFDVGVSSPALASFIR